MSVASVSPSPIYHISPEMETIQPAQFTMTKPVLSTPMHMIKYVCTLETLYDDWMSLGIDVRERQMKEMAELRAEMAKKIKEAAHKSMIAQVWDIVKKVASIIAAAALAVVGFAVGGTTLVGAALIAAAALALTNLAFTELKVWNWLAELLVKENEERQQLAVTLLSGGTAGLSAILGGAGLFTGWSSLPLMAKSMSIVYSASCFAEGTSEMAKSYNEAEVLKIEGKRFEFDKGVFTKTQAIEEQTETLKFFSEHQKKARDTAIEYIKLTDTMNEIILRG